MYTIPLDPVFDNQKFIDAPHSVQLAVLKTTYYLCRKNLIQTDYVNRVYPLTGLYNQQFAKYKVLIFSILQEVIPEIIRVKRISGDRADKAGKAVSAKAMKKHSEKYNGTLAEPIPENQAPIMPQHSALSVTLNRQRVIPTLPPASKKPAVKPPSLTEKT